MASQQKNGDVDVEKRVSGLVAHQNINAAILVVRGFRVILDEDLANLYGVKTKVLVQGVKRNADRFPEDFMFQLSMQEFAELKKMRSQSGGKGGRRYPPYAFTEQGVAMVSSVLNSAQAILVNIEIMRAFVHLRTVLSTHKEFAEKLRDLEDKYDSQFKAVFQAIHALMETKSKCRPIGFVVKRKDS